MAVTSRPHHPPSLLAAMHCSPHCRGAEEACPIVEWAPNGWGWPGPHPVWAPGTPLPGDEGSQEGVGPGEGWDFEVGVVGPGEE